MGKILIIQGADFSQYKVDSIKMPYNGPVEIPQISIDSESKLVTLTANENLDIYYTTDGTNPSLETTHYSSPFEITNNTTVKTISTNGKTVSQVPKITATINVDNNTLELSSSIEGTIRYTSNNTVPISSSTEYNSTITTSIGKTYKVAVFLDSSIISEITSIQIIN